MILFEESPLCRRLLSSSSAFGSARAARGAGNTAILFVRQNELKSQKNMILQKTLKNQAFIKNRKENAPLIRTRARVYMAGRRKKLLEKRPRASTVDAVKPEKTTARDTDASANAAPIRTRARGRPRICAEVVEVAPKKRGGARPGAGAKKGTHKGRKRPDGAGSPPLKFGEKSKLISIKFAESDYNKILNLSKINDKKPSSFVREIFLKNI